MANSCSICLQDLGESNVPQYLQNKNTDELSYVDKVMMRLEIKGNQIMETPCKHKFHPECLIEWLVSKKECPNCRKEVEVDF